MERAESTVRRWLRRGTSPDHIEPLRQRGVQPLCEVAPYAYPALPARRSALEHALTMLAEARTVGQASVRFHRLAVGHDRPIGGGRRPVYRDEPAPAESGRRRWSAGIAPRKTQHGVRCSVLTEHRTVGRLGLDIEDYVADAFAQLEIETRPGVCAVNSLDVCAVERVRVRSLSPSSILVVDDGPKSGERLVARVEEHHHAFRMSQPTPPPPPARRAEWSHAIGKNQVNGPMLWRAVDRSRSAPQPPGRSGPSRHGWVRSRFPSVIVGAILDMRRTQCVEIRFDSTVHCVRNCANPDAQHV